MTLPGRPALCTLAYALALSSSTLAQSPNPSQPHRIGFVGVGARGSTLDAFTRGLREAGYVEGKSFVIESRFADGNVEKLPSLIADVLGRKVEVLVVGSTSGAAVAKRATQTIPIVFAGGVYPVPDIVSSLAHPEGNITGIVNGISGEGFGGKWIELLKQTAPGLFRVAVLSNPADPTTPLMLKEIRAAAAALGMRVEEAKASGKSELDQALATIASSGVQGMVVLPSAFFARNRGTVVQFASSRRLPAIYSDRRFAEAGGLMSYGGNLEEAYRRAAAYVDKILKGAKPSDLPIEQPTRVELVVNLRTAKALGVSLPRSLVDRADELIE